VIILEHPPYSDDLVTADFCLFPGLISALKGRRFCDATDVITKGKEELKSSSVASRNISNIFTVAVRSV